MSEYNFDNLSVGVTNLKDGYVAYAKEVIVDRALPSLYDGLKPVHRRVLVSLKNFFKKDAHVKSADLAGSTMKLHPHGEASIYDAFVKMTDRNSSMELPLLCGQGNFGYVSTADVAAAPRYTEVWLHPNTDEYFKDMAGATIVPSYDGNFREPENLPVSYPAVLCNSTNGIAVGFRGSIPSFNFNDVLDLTMEYIKNGKCETIIYPDFVTGGFYIKNNKELDKLMKMGKAKLKLRGRVEKVGKELSIVELPYSTDTNKVVKQIKAANIPAINEFGDTSDRECRARITIDCKKNRVDEALLALYKKTDLQTTFSAELFVVKDDTPVRLGVWGIIEEWVKWRRSVVLKRLTKEVEDIKAEMVESKAFITVFEDKEKLDVITNLILHESDDAAVKYILDNFDNEIVTPELARWITSRRINVFRTGGKYLTRYEQLMADLREHERNITDIDAYILKELEDLKAREGAKHPRRTEVTTTDYEFKESDDGVVQKDTNLCYYTLKSGFLRKSRFISEGDEFTCTALASDTLIALDNRGRVLRVYCEDLPYSGTTELGTYLPRYFELNETDDYEITWIGVLDGKTKMLLYTDGNVGFLDTAEWVGLNRRVKVLEKGISVSCADKLGAVLEDVPEWLYVIDNDGKLGYAMTSEIKRKDRTAKTRVFNLGADNRLTGYAPMTVEDGALYVSNVSRYAAPKLQYLESSDSLLGDADVFISMMR